MMQEWFKQAKLGIFIHWGLYAVKGIPESWAMATGEYSYEEYMKQREEFTANKYDAKQWAKLIKQSGARYAVLTTKHHEGFALFDTQYTDLNAVKSTPAGRDLIAPYCEALREEGLKVGLYFSNTDWADSDHMQVILDLPKEELEKQRHQPTPFWERWQEIEKRENEKECVQIVPEQEAAWRRFMTRYKGEITELLTNYGTVDVLWFDVMLERKGYSWESQRVKEMINQISPMTIVNERLGEYGDYKTPELYIPLAPIDEPWEMCSAFNDSWGYNPNDHNYKEIKQIVRMLCECISKGGNLLISIGPDGQGEIPEETQAKMIELGKWTQKYEEAIYPTTKGLTTEYFLGGSTLTQDKQTLYLFAYDCSSGKLMLNGIKSPIKKITSLVNGRKLTHRMIGGAGWLDIPGSIWIDLEEQDRDEICTVIKVEFEEAIKLLPVNQESSSRGQNQ